MGFSKRQLGVLLAARVVEPISYTILFPFVNTMMEDVLPDVSKANIGRYSGAIESIFAFSSVLFMYQWGKLSDRIGRKPVIIGGLFGLSFSLFIFGISRTFWWAMIARAMGGALCGNSSVMRAVLGEMTTKETEGWVYPLWSVCWDLSCVVGPTLGALLVDPSRQYPNSWVGTLRTFQQYPYLLPCAVVSSLSFSAMFLVLFGLEETHHNHKKHAEIKTLEPSERTLLLPEEPIDTIEALPPAHTFMELISIAAVQQVLLSGFFLTLTAMSFDAVFVLFAYSSTRLGGLALSPKSIALCLSIKGALSIILSLSFFPMAQRKFGTQMLYRIFAACWIVVYAIPPVMNALASGPHDEAWVADGSMKDMWFLMIPHLLLYVVGDWVFPLNMMALNMAAPSPSSLGGLNGISLSVSALARSVGPAAIGSLYSVSAREQFPIVWLVFGGIAALSALQSWRVKAQREDEVEG
ncbi:hypothetical protein P7C73_g3383, partial [Tremellales sp. Uapishka_1]